MGRGKELIQILGNPYCPRRDLKEALDGLTKLHTREAIAAIGEIARNPYRPAWLRDKARDYLTRRRKT